MTIGRTPVLEARYSRCLAVLALAYFVIYGWLLAKTSLLPYVIDNNETFSALWHASNLFHYGVAKTFGVTDESFSFSAAAHPYVYTHGGNFPRLFALVLYALGARTAETQILITTFTVGVAAIFLAYHFFSRIANPLFALICCLLLISDYILVGQWQVVTYRVWHEFFVFSSLLCVHGFAERRRFWPILTVVNFACLFYFELVFVAFVALTTAIYAAAHFRRAPKRLLTFWVLEGVGAAIGVGVLAAQLVLYLGWNNFLQDAYLTFVARNDFQDSGVLLQRMQAFFESHHIAFWYNLADGREFRNLAYFLRSFTYYEFQVHTPFFTTLCWILLFGLAGAWASGLLLRVVDGSIKAEQPGRFEATHAGVLLYASVLAFLFVVLGKTYLWGILDHLKWSRPASAGYAVFSALAAAAVVALYSMSAGRPAGSRLARLLPPPERTGATVRVALFVLLVTGLIFNSGKLYDDRYVLLWLRILHSLVPDAVACAFAVLATGLGAAFFLRGPKIAGETGLSGAWARIAIFLGAGLIGYAIVFVLAPGIVFTGYRFRLVPLTAFHTEVLTAIVFYVVLAFGLNRLGAAGLVRGSSTEGGQPWARRGNVAMGAASLAIFGFLCYYWIGTQAVYLRLLPPDYLPVLDELSKAPYKGKTFIANTYAAPIAAKTGNWAYLHAMLNENKLEIDGNSVRIPFDKRYLWFADRDSNPDYARPDYFLCITVQSPYTVAARLNEIAAGKKTLDFGCQIHRVVMLARDRGRKNVYPSLELTGVDTEGPRKVGYERWAIVKLDWGRKESRSESRSANHSPAPALPQSTDIVEH